MGLRAKGQGQRESQTHRLSLSTYQSVPLVNQHCYKQSNRDRHTDSLSLDLPPVPMDESTLIQASSERERHTHTQLLCPCSPNGPTLIQTVNRERHTERCSPCQCTRRPKEAPGGPRGPNEPKKLHNHGDRDRAQLRHTYQTSNDNIMKP